MAQNVILRISKKITEIEDLLHVREHVGQILEAFASRCTTLTLYTSRYTDTWLPICTGYLWNWPAHYQRWQAFNRELGCKLGDQNGYWLNTRT